MFRRLGRFAPQLGHVAGCDVGLQAIALTRPYSYHGTMFDAPPEAFVPTGFAPSDEQEMEIGAQVDV